jgi:hypothetical protein
VGFEKMSVKIFKDGFRCGKLGRTKIFPTCQGHDACCGAFIEHCSENIFIERSDNDL